MKDITSVKSSQPICTCSNFRLYVETMQVMHTLHSAARTNPTLATRSGPFSILICL